VGKSSIIAKLIELYRKEDRRVGVVSVDPSSPFSKGAILGTASASRTTSWIPGCLSGRWGAGGIWEAGRWVAAGGDGDGGRRMDVVLYETVGVGQGEVEVASAADTVVLALQPGAGDAVQALKAGVMEIADVFCINKAITPGPRARPPRSGRYWR
jgi:LAO/AO transport system kinase